MSKNHKRESMKAALIKEYGKIVLDNIRKPVPGDNDVLIKVIYASICGSDQHILKGEFHPRTKLPLVPGHEFAGIVEFAGRDVKKVSPGDKVTVDPIIWCGRCAACERGHYPACTSLRILGIDLDGGFAEYVSVPAGMVYKIPSHVSDENAALTEILSIGFHASSRAGVSEGDDILIVGSGKVGISILHAVKMMTSGKVIIADVLDERLKFARDAFSDIFTVNVRKSDPVQFVKEITGGRGVDIAFEAVGHEMPVEGRFNPVRICINAIRGAGKVCVLGLSDHPAELLMKELIWKEAVIIASRVSHGEFARVIDVFEKGLLHPEKMITAIMPLEEAMKGFEYLENEPHKHLKILLKI